MIDPMLAQGQNSSCPDPNSGRVNAEEPAKLSLSRAVPNKAPGSPPTAPLTTDLLYKGAMAARFAEKRRAWEAKQAYPELFKVAFDKVIGEVKHQPSPMKVTAVGEGDFSRLKIKPWQINGEEAWDTMENDVRKTTPKR